jgi:hypothetical protein
MITKLYDLYSWIMENEYTCGFGHTFTGIISAYCLTRGYGLAGLAGLYAFIVYEGLEQFRQQTPKDDADVELRQCLLGFFISLTFFLIF